MKQVFFLAFLLFLINFQSAQAENIDNFSVDFKIDKNSSVYVTESISYNFGELQRHGIYRSIPYKYKTQTGNYKLRFSQINVTDEFGHPYKFFTSYRGNNLWIKIGEADKLVSGRHVYIIRYKVERVLNYFSDHDEFYWNVTGNGWPVPITEVVARIHLPRDVSGLDLQTKCFFGSYGATDKCSQKKILSSGVEFKSYNLSPREGLTIVIGWPKGIVQQPTWWQKTKDWFRDNLVLFLPLLVLFIMFFLWWNKGRDPRGRGVIIPRYAPPADLTPVEVGTIIDEKVDRRDIVSIIIDLAIKGYLKITRLTKKSLWGKKVDYQFEQLRPGDKSLKILELVLLDSLFKDSQEVANYIGFSENKKKVLLSELNKNSCLDIKNIEELVYNELIKSGYFRRNPNSVRMSYLGVAFAFVMAGFVIIDAWGMAAFFSFFLSGLIIGFFGWFMPSKTKRGVETYEHILGLKEYLEIAEKDRLKFHNAPKKNPQLFEELLPYAIVLKVEKQWAEQFKDIYKQPPAWYEDPSVSSFNTLVFINSLHSFSVSTISTLNFKGSSAAGGGSGFSGGFSGGGFGGGGGGSW